MRRCLFPSRLLAPACALLLVLPHAGASDAYLTTSPGFAGPGSNVPSLSGGGQGTPGAKGVLHVMQTEPFATSMLVVGLAELAAPFQGGILGPSPDLILGLGATNAQGALSHNFRMPAPPFPGNKLWLQVWARSEGGYAATNTLRLKVTPPPTALGRFAGRDAEAPSLVDGFVAADFDGDGLLDLAVSSSKIDLLFGAGDAEFVPDNKPIQGGGDGELVSADFNGDGAVDLAVARGILMDVAIRLNKGGGEFLPAISAPTNTLTSDLAVADLNADGVADLVALGALPTRAVALLGVGDGNFVESWTEIQPGPKGRLALGDVNGDGIVDLVLALRDPGMLSVRPGLGDGSFGPPTNYDAGVEPSRLVLSDLNGDGDLDAVVVGASDPGSRVAILRNITNTSFSAPTLFMAGQGLGDIVVLDANADGILDLLVTNYFGSTEPGRVTTLLGVGAVNYTLGPTMFTGDGPWGLVAADFDLDGAPDLAVAHTGGGISSSSGVTSFRGLAGGGFLQPQRLGVGQRPGALDFGDVDMDGELDLVVLRASQPGVPGGVSVRRGLGAESFAPNQTLDAAGDPALLALGDLDGVGGVDAVVVGFEAPNRVSTLLATQGAPPLAPFATLDTGSAVTSLALRDLDGDARLDLVASLEGSASVHIWPGLGDGSFGAPTSLDAGALVPALAAGDVDGDGDTDLVALVASSDTREHGALLWRGNGDGSFATPLHVATEKPPVSLALPDIGGDGVLDLAVGSHPQSLELFLGDRQGAFTPGSSTVLPFLATGWRAGDLDGDGSDDLLARLPDQDRIALVRLIPNGTLFFEPVFYIAGDEPSGLFVGALDGDGADDIAIANAGSNNVWILRNQGAD